MSVDEAGFRQKMACAIGMSKSSSDRAGCEPEDSTKAQQDQSRRQADSPTGELGLGELSPQQIKTTGTIERVLYRSEDEQFLVVALKQKDGASVVITGPLGPCSPGEEVEVVGSWSQHPKYGQRLQVEKFTSKTPQTLVGLRKFLASGLIPGIGEKRARQIVERFGASTAEVLDHEGDRLQEIPGIGPRTAKRAADAFKEYKGLRELLVFLQGYGIGVARGMQIFREYGAGAARILSTNPYRMADDISGIGFRTADEIATKLGIRHDDPQRITAGLLFVLQTECEKGHTYLPKQLLLESAKEILSVDDASVLQAYQSLCQDERIALDPLSDDAVFLPDQLKNEVAVAQDLSRIMSGPLPFQVTEALKACADSEQDDGLSLSGEQAAAVSGALSSKAVVITGGPGTGKTALIGRLARTCRRLVLRLALCAPTGRAAKRLSEATGFEAKTVHRLLKYDAFERHFKYNRHNKLPADFVVIDEASMVDVPLMSRLLAALPASSSIAIVGDADQLPSVGPGAVLNDIIASGVVPTARLSHIFRQKTEDGSENLIVVNAHRINRGAAPVFPKRSDRGAGQFYFVDRDSPDEVLATVVELAADRIPRRFGFDPLTQVQVLTPMHKGKAGTKALNEMMQMALNSSGTPVQFGGRIFRVRDKVMQTRNNYDKDVFNGDIGVIERIDPVGQKLVVNFGDRKVSYSPVEMAELELAYAISVHKSQGSEYNAVVMPLITQHFMLLQRNLIYTAVTRAKRLVVMVGSKKALFMAIGNNRTAERYTLLAARLKAFRA